MPFDIAIATAFSPAGQAKFRLFGQNSFVFFLVLLSNIAELVYSYIQFFFYFWIISQEFTLFTDFPRK